MPKIIKRPGVTAYYQTEKVSFFGTYKTQKPISFKVHKIVDEFIKNFPSEAGEDELKKADKIKRVFYLGVWHDNPEIIIAIVRNTPRQWLHISRVCGLQDLITDEVIQKFQLLEYEKLLQMSVYELKKYDLEQKELRAHKL